MATTSSWDDLDDTSSFTGSFYTTSSSSTVPGPGAITGRFLKAVGERSLDLVVNVIIRSHLRAIDRTLTKSPHVLRNPWGDEEWKRMVEAYNDLHELCRESRSSYYPISLQREAARLIHDITLTTRPEPEFFIDASPTNDKWEALLARIQQREDIQFLPRAQSLSLSKPNMIASSSDVSKDDEGISFPWNFQHHVHVNGNFQGLPSSWAASLAGRPDGRLSLDHRAPNPPHRTINSGSLGRLGEPHSLSRAPTQAVLRRGARRLRKSPLLRHIQAIVNEFSARDAVSFEDVTVPMADDSIPLPSSSPTQNYGNRRISLPWNFKHHVHVNENLQGLPPSWIALLSQVGFSQDEITAVRQARVPMSVSLSSRVDSNANSTHLSAFTRPLSHEIHVHAPPPISASPSRVQDSPVPEIPSPPPPYTASAPTPITQSLEQGTDEFRQDDGISTSLESANPPEMQLYLKPHSEARRT